MNGEALTRRVLFLCTGNSARSILAEALMNRLSQGKVVAHSAGSHPLGRVNPAALALLSEKGFSVSDLRSKSWDEFDESSAMDFDLVITVCDHAAEQICPVWRGSPRTIHWGLPDPAAVSGSDSEIRSAFERTYQDLENRIQILLNTLFS